MAAILDEAGVLPVLDQAGNQILDETASLTLPASFYPLGILVELLINNTWTDISQFVYQRDDIVITGGGADEAVHPTPAQATLTLDNRDGRFSPNYTAGAYYPYLNRNVQIRISVTATSVTGNHYSGARFTGEVAKWPPVSDPTATDVYVQVTANGPLRRIRAGGGQGSALARYYSLLTGSYTPIAYWPCEEDPDTTVIGAGIDGGQDMTVISGTPKWKHLSNFNGSAPMPMLNGSVWEGLTGSFASSGDDVYTTPGTYGWVASTTSIDCRCWGAGGGSLGLGYGGAGGGEFAEESTLAVTPGTTYNVVVGAGGQGHASSSGAANGKNSSFAGDSVTVTAHGGHAPPGSGNYAGGTGGTGSSNTTHHNGGNGGGGAGPSNDGGGGGGGSGGTALAGNNGSTTVTNTGANGAVAVTGGGPGGKGGSTNTAGLTPVSGPGGGAGSSGNGISHPAGVSGFAGKVELIYTPASVPNNNVIRFVMQAPDHGENPAILLRVLTGGTVARLDVLYQAGGKLELKGFDSGASTLFDSGNQSWSLDGRPVMISVELAKSGSNVAWKFKAVDPGASTLIGSASGTVSGSMGNVTEVDVNPAGGITQTAIAHISVQYALVDLLHVSKAVNGHHTELTTDRFIRLANEQALDNFPQFAETTDHFGFETGIQGFGSNSGVVSQSNTWSSEGNFSLKLSATGEGFPVAFSPFGANGIPVNPGDIVSLSMDLFCPVTLNQVFVGIKFFKSDGTALAETDSADQQLGAVQPVDPFTGTFFIPKFTVTATAPALAAFFNVRFGNHDTGVAAGSLLYADHISVQPQMGPQTRKEYHKFLEEIKHMDQGILREIRDNFGLAYRTRWTMFLQTPAVTLDYSAAQLVGQLAPVIDDQKTANHIVVHRHKGSKVTVTKTDGQMSVTEPPSGAGRYKKTHNVVAAVDEQLLNLATLLLNFGTVTDERYPVISVNLARTEVASIMSALAGVEMGDFVKITNLPFWYPSATAEQLVVGYTETINAFNWTIDWNCVPESPWELSISSVRWW